IGIARARVKIGLANLAYNMRRFVWLDRRHGPRCGRLTDKEPPHRTISQSIVPLTPYWPIANNPFNQPSKPRFWRNPIADRVLLFARMIGRRRRGVACHIASHQLAWHNPRAP